MADRDDDPEIGALNVHLSGEPAQAIVVSGGQAAIEDKNNVLAVMPHFYGRKVGNPYVFLHEFCKLCGIQNRPAGLTEEEYRLRVLPFALKGEADTWFMRLPPNSIRTWADFKSVFLDYFFPATRTNALKKEIQGATQEGDETLSMYWSRFKGMLDACPNNRMTEAEIFNNFYEGMTSESKDLVNSSSGGDFSRLRVSEARKVINRLIDAKKAYDNPRAQAIRRAPVHAAADQADDKMEARMDRLEKAVLNALKKTSNLLLPRSAKRHSVKRRHLLTTVHRWRWIISKQTQWETGIREAIGIKVVAGCQGREMPRGGSTPISAGRSRTRIHLPSQAMRSHRKKVPLAKQE
ncbi:hypothetical protein AAHA92_16550 [Salvia divinorum]|uniref:Retrotransposon gag domain-containing protein n=1 Tax=Salvia divinorum TaxID=28513 RepID=A0ABD1GZ97_SALDI